MEQMDVETAIIRTLNRMDETEFEWGTNDCDVIMADYVMMFGHADPLEGYRGTYHDKNSAYALLDEKPNSAWVSKGLASVGIFPKENPWDTAKRGDVVSADFGGAHITGLCLGTRCAFKALRRGMLQKKSLKIIKAWSVCD